MGLVEEHVKLTNSILAGDLTVDQVKSEINRIESEYGSGSFDSCKVRKKSAPWTKEDLDELEIQSALGTCSKDFYLYMAEVSEFVYKKNKKSGLMGYIQKAIGFIAKHWLLFLAIIVACWVVAKLVG